MSEPIQTIQYADLEADLRIATGIRDGDDSDLKTAYNAASRYANGIIAGSQVNPTKFLAVLATSLFEMAILRFNRLSHEGEKAHENDGESITWLHDMYAPWDDKLASVIIDDEATGWTVKVFSEDDMTDTATYEVFTPMFGLGNVWFWQNDAEPYRTKESGGIR